MEAQSPLSIGILQTDSVRAEFIDRHGDYPAMFRALLMGARGFGEGGRPLVFRDYDVRRGCYPARTGECDAYLITGSKDSVYDEANWIRNLEAFVRTLHAHRHPLVGVCFGHQLVAQALGGETRAAEQGWAVGVHSSRVLRTMPWMEAPASEFALLSSHRDQVTRLPEGADLIATSDFCPNAAFTLGQHILCFQGHPEFVSVYASDLMDQRREILGEDTWARGKASLDVPIHQTRVGRWILAFMEQEWTA